jgi:hypothetical protein
MPRRWVDDRGRSHEVTQPAPDAPEPRFSRLLALQRSAGNAAVARQLQATRAMVAREDGSEDVTAPTDMYTDPGQGAVNDVSETSEEQGEKPLAALTRAATERSIETGGALRGNVAEDETPEDEGTDSLAEGTNYQVQQQGDDETDSITSISEDEPDVPVAPAAPADDSMTSISEDEPDVPVAPPPTKTVYQNPDAGSSKYVPATATVYKNVPPPAAAAAAPRRPGRAKRFLKAITKPFRAIGKGIANLRKRKPKGVTAQDLLADDEFEPGAVATGESESTGSVSAAVNYKDAPQGLKASQSFSSISESTNRATKVKYADLAKMAGGHKNEETGSAAFVNDLLVGALAYDMKRFNLAAKTEDDNAIIGDRARVRNALQKIWGWSAADVAKYYDNKSGKVAGTTVKYIRSAKDLASYAVKMGSTLLQGEPPQPLDTALMVSKASGPGFGIFVMDAAGNLYVGQHKVGLFHHSSFKAGGDVAAAGELKVTGGKLVEVTAKSGHYTPTPAQTSQVLRALSDSGAALAGVRCKVWIQQGNGMLTVVYDADEFLRLGSGAKKLAIQGMM